MGFLNFEKHTALGNNFVFIDGRDNSEELGITEAPMKSYAFAAEICDRNFGIGADGLVVLQKSENADFRFRIFNDDGSEPEMCGNAIRCFANWVYELKLTDKKTFTVETLAGTITPTVMESTPTGGDTAVLMTSPQLLSTDLRKETPLKDESILDSEGTPIDDRKWHFVSMGNPHIITFVDSYDFDLDEVGADLTNKIKHQLPNGSNIEFIKVNNRNDITMRVYERGVGITLACGTGACASVVAAVNQGLCDEEVTVHLDGGDLKISYDREKNSIIMTGPSTLVAKGNYLPKQERY